MTLNLVYVCLCALHGRCEWIWKDTVHCGSVYPPWRQVCNFWCLSRSSRETKWGKNCSFLLQAGDFDWFWLTNMTNGSMVSLQFPYCEMEAFFPPNLVWAGCNRDHISPSAGAFRPSKAGKDEKTCLAVFRSRLSALLFPGFSEKLWENAKVQWLIIDIIILLLNIAIFFGVSPIFHTIFGQLSIFGIFWYCQRGCRANLLALLNGPGSEKCDPASFVMMPWKLIASGND